MPAACLRRPRPLASRPRSPGRLAASFWHRLEAASPSSEPRSSLTIFATLVGVYLSESWVTTTFRRPVTEPGDQAGTRLARDRDLSATLPQAQSGPESGPESRPESLQAKHQVGTKSAPSRRQVEILRNCLTEKTIRTLMAFAGRKDRTKFRNQVLKPLLDAGWLEMTLPDKPTSSKQKYRLTVTGQQVLAELGEDDA